MASAMEQFVNNVRTFSGQGNFHDLCEYLNKNLELLIRNPSNLGTVLETLDIQQHSLGVLAVLTAKLHQQTINDWDDLYNRIVVFILECNGEQVRHSPQAFAEMCHLFTDQLVQRRTPIRGLAVLSKAVGKIQLTETSLTSVHADVCKLALLSRCFHPVMEFLQTDYVDIGKECSQGDPKYLLLFFYYGGMILAALKDFERALYFFEVTVTIPSIAVSHIMMEAYKKYLLISLIVQGDKPKETSHLPKFTAPVVNKFIKPICSAYQELVTAYYSNRAEELQNVITKYTETYTTDNNMGLVNQVAVSQTKTNIKRLTKTFVTLSLQDVAGRVGLGSPREAEKMLIEMIQEGAIHARISQKDGMVRFDSNPEQFDSVLMLQRLDENIRHCINLDKRITGMEEEILVNPNYIKKSSGVRGEVDDDPTPSGSRGPSSNAVGSSAGGGPKVPSYSCM